MLRLGDFALERVVGKGAFSTVFKAQRKSQTCALKKLAHPESSLLQQELSALKSVDHPNIIQYYSYFQSEDGVLCIELEWADGGNLQQLLSRHSTSGKHFSEERIWDFFVQIARAIKYLHVDCSIFHLDLKPANILVTRESILKVSDLGLSRRRLLKDNDLANQVYMAPELLKTPPALVTFACDIWSMGCVLYEIICLHSPFSTSSNNRGEYPPIPEKPRYSPELRGLVAGLLQIHSQLRPSAQSVLLVAEHAASLFVNPSLSPPPPPAAAFQHPQQPRFRPPSLLIPPSPPSIPPPSPRIPQSPRLHRFVSSNVSTIHAPFRTGLPSPKSAQLQSGSGGEFSPPPARRASLLRMESTTPKEQNEGARFRGSLHRLSISTAESPRLETRNPFATTRTNLDEADDDAAHDLAKISSDSPFKFPLWSQAKQKLEQFTPPSSTLPLVVLPPTPPLQQLPPPQDERPPPYILGDIIGEGSFARVYRAVHVETGVSIAVKQMLVKDHVEEMEKEISFLKELDHPNLVRYLFTRKSKQGELFVVLEYCMEGSISQMLKTYKKFPEQLIQVYTRQMNQALVYLHSRGIVHRDIKGGNVLVHGEGSRAIVKLADFGCSKRLTSQPHASPDLEKSNKQRLKGTVLWMAPEAARQHEISTSSDIWSMGATIIEMTGDQPWKEENFNNELVALLKIATTSSPPLFPSQLSVKGRQFLKNCMEIDPNKRWSAKQLMLHSFLAPDAPKAVQTAVVGKRSEIVGSGNRDVREIQANRRAQGLIDQVMLLLCGLKEMSFWPGVAAREIVIGLPQYSQLDNQLLPLVFEHGTAQTDSLNAYLALMTADQKEGMNRFIVTEVKTLQERIQCQSKTAMWRWQAWGHWSDTPAAQVGRLEGTGSATFDSSMEKIKAIEISWDATVVMQ